MTVLVTAASKHGATVGIADAIADGLTKRGIDARVLAPEEVMALDGYTGVVIGSAVYGGHWLDEAKAFVESHAAGLPDLPVWLFSSGPLGEPGHLAPEEETVDAAPIVDATGAIAHRTFAGKLDQAKLTFTERAMIIAFRAPEGDFRDWEAIDAYAGEISQRLQTDG